MPLGSTGVRFKIVVQLVSEEDVIRRCHYSTVCENIDELTFSEGL